MYAVRLLSVSIWSAKISLSLTRKRAFVGSVIRVGCRRVSSGGPSGGGVVIT